MPKDADDPIDGWSNGAVTPDDDEAIHPLPRAFCVLTAGDVSIEDAAGNVLTWTSVPASPQPYPYRVARLLEATTAEVALLY